MITLICALQMLRVKYDFPVGRRIPYVMSVKFQGYIPVLGGKDGTVETTLQVAVVGQSPDAQGNPQVRSEIEELKMVLNGATLPLTAKNVQAFFPPTTISLTPEGQILKTDAPDAKLGVQLPGLDAKRFPDISYLPIEFPVDGISVAKRFTFKKAFGTSQVQYEVSPTKISDDSVDLDVTMSQDYDGLEDDRHNPVTADPGFKLTTHVEGKGTAIFDRKRSLVTSLHIEAEAKTHLVGVKDKAESDRDLKTVLDVKTGNREQG